MVLWWEGSHRGAVMDGGSEKCVQLAMPLSSLLVPIETHCIMHTCCTRTGSLYHLLSRSTLVAPPTPHYKPMSHVHPNFNERRCHLVYVVACSTVRPLCTTNPTKSCERIHGRVSSSILQFACCVSKVCHAVLWLLPYCGCIPSVIISNELMC
jgi:hypothetical protein